MDQVFEGGTKIYSNDLVKIFLFQEKSDDNWSMGPVQQEVGGEDGGVQWESRPGPGGRWDPIVTEAPLELTNLDFQHLVDTGTFWKQQQVANNKIRSLFPAVCLHGVPVRCVQAD